VCTTERTYTDAQEVCAGLDDSTVSLFETTQERDKIYAGIDINPLIPDTAMKDIWLGISRADANSICNNGCNEVSEPIPLQWASGEPAEDAGECVKLSKGFQDAWKWHVEPCNDTSTKLPFICESQEEYDACDEKDDANPCPENCFQVDFGSQLKGYQCCAVGYSWAIDECVSMNPCDKEVNPCGEHGTCKTTEDDYECECDIGYVVNNGTCIKPKSCGPGQMYTEQLCGTNGTCVNLPDNEGYECKCDLGSINDKLLPNGLCVACKDGEWSSPLGCLEATDVAPDCQSYLNADVTGTPILPVDPNGPDKDPGPFYVQCDLTEDDNDSSGWTQIARYSGGGESPIVYGQEEYEVGFTYENNKKAWFGNTINITNFDNYATPCAAWEQLGAVQGGNGNSPLQKYLVVRVSLYYVGAGEVKSGVRDYYMPKKGDGELCDMLMNADQHIWWGTTKEGTGKWVSPETVAGDNAAVGHGLGGSAKGFPKGFALPESGVIDERSYLTFWGSKLNEPGACCFDGNAPTEAWGRAFDIAVKVVEAESYTLVVPDK